MCFSVLSFYSSDIPRRKDMSCLNHGITVRQRLGRCIKKRMDIQDLQSQQCETCKESTSAKTQLGGCLKGTELEKKKRIGGKEKALGS